MIATRTAVAVDGFESAMRKHGRPEAEIKTALGIAAEAQQVGLVPLFRAIRQDLAFRWPASERTVGGVFAMWAREGQLSFEMRWLLCEPAFRGEHGGNDLEAKLRVGPIQWIRPPQGRGFPNVSLSTLDAGPAHDAVISSIGWIVDRLNDAATSALAAASGSQTEPEIGGRSRAVVVEATSNIAKEIDDVIEGLLDRYKLAYTRAADGSYELPRSYEAWLGRAVMVHISRHGIAGTILHVSVTPDRLTPEPRWDDVRDACNEWNALTLWPKVYLREEDPDAQGIRVGRVVGEGSLELKRGVHPAFLDDWINGMIGTNFDFWKWMTQVKGL